MKRFKVVAHYITADEFIYRLYERSQFIFWTYVSSFATFDQVNNYISDIYEKEKNTEIIPKDKIVGYV